MKFDVVNKSTTVNIFVLHTLHRNITHLPVITRKTNIKLGILFCLKGGNWKRAKICQEKNPPREHFFRTFVTKVGKISAEHSLTQRLLSVK